MEPKELKAAAEQLSLTGEEKQAMIDACAGKKRRPPYRRIAAIAAALLVLTALAAAPGLLFRAGRADKAADAMVQDEAATQQYGEYALDAEDKDVALENATGAASIADSATAQLLIRSAPIPAEAAVCLRTSTLLQDAAARMDGDTFSVGEAFAAADPLDSDDVKAVFFPLVQAKGISLVLCVTKTADGWTGAVSEAAAAALNSLQATAPDKPAVACCDAAGRPVLCTADGVVPLDESIQNEPSAAPDYAALLAQTADWRTVAYARAAG